MAGVLQNIFYYRYKLNLSSLAIIVMLLNFNYCWLMIRNIVTRSLIIQNNR